MDIYKALKPLYYFSKCTGTATFTLEINGEFAVKSRDKVLTLTISTAWLLFTLYSLSLSAVEPPSVLAAFMDTSNIATALDTSVSFPVMYKNNNLVIISIQQINHVDEAINLYFEKCPNNFATRKKIVRHISLYLVVLVAVLLYSSYVFYVLEGTVPSFLYFSVLFVFAYLLNMSKMCFLGFFLDTLTKRFQIVNDVLIRDPENNIRNVIEMHKKLCDISKNVNAAFQVAVLGRISFCCMAVMLALFILITGVIGLADAGFIGISAMVMSSRYVSESVGIIYAFWKLRQEVSIKHVFYRTKMIPIT